MYNKILLVVGARPNFMKIDAIIRELELYPNNFSFKLVHTGQHYDDRMSKIFFKDLDLHIPDIDLDVRSSRHAEQTGMIMIKLEKILIKEKPNLVIVVGDVNSTLAAAITAAKLNIPIAHVEAGLRSFDKKMPEEINRIVTDALSTYLFTTSKEADSNLKREGIADKRIYFVGNVMIDTLMRCRPKYEKSDILKKLNIKRNKYLLLTLHRPSNVDNSLILHEIVNSLKEIQKKVTVVFPIHPRTQKKLIEYGLSAKLSKMSNILLIEPLGYIDFIALELNAKAVLTDSGGIQEETTVLGVPCFTLRDSTERPITVIEGTNKIIGYKQEEVIEAVFSFIKNNHTPGKIPELWDGKAASRIIDVLKGNTNEFV